MNRSNNNPATFIAMPCTPVGRPNRKSSRMIARSGALRMPGARWMTESGHRIRQRPKAETIVLLRDRPERRAERAESRDEHHVEGDREHRHDDPEPEGRPGVAGGPKGPAQEKEDHHAEDAGEHRPQERQGLRGNGGRRVDQIEQLRRREPPGRSERQRHRRRRQKRLIDDAIDLVRSVGAGEARDEHAHAAEHGVREDDDDDHDLPADPDGGVGGIADEVADHRVVDDPLQARDGVLQHRRPGDFPDGRANRTFDQGAVERSRCATGLAHRGSRLTFSASRRRPRASSATPEDRAPGCRPGALEASRCAAGLRGRPTRAASRSSQVLPSRSSAW